MGARARLDDVVRVRERAGTYRVIAVDLSPLGFRYVRPMAGGPPFRVHLSELAPVLAEAPRSEVTA